MSQTDRHSPSPSLSGLQRETPFLFCWRYAQIHTNCLLLGYRQLHQQKPRFRQTKPVPHLADLPLQGPADGLLPGCPRVDPRTLVGQLSGSAAQQHPVAFCSSGCKRRNPVSTTANAPLELVPFLPLSLCGECTGFQHTLSTLHHIRNVSTQEMPDCACGTLIHPGALLASLRGTDAAALRGLTFKTTRAPSAGGQLCCEPWAKHHQTWCTSLPLPPWRQLGRGRVVLWRLASLGLGGQGWHAGLRRGPQQCHKVVFSFTALLLLLLLWPPVSQASWGQRGAQGTQVCTAGCTDTQIHGVLWLKR